MSLGRIHIGNRTRGGLWWRIPAVLSVWALLATPIVVGLIGLAVLRDYARGLPTVPDLDRWEEAVPRTNLLVASDGTPVAEIPFTHGAEAGHRLPVAYHQIPDLLVRAILAAEDARFFQHQGVDARAVARAAWANYRAGHIVEGASTITQQVARNLLEEIGTERTLRRKVREALLARRLERRYSKTRIFETYANHVFLGAGAYGVAAAARGYFSKSLAELTLAESALLAGLIQAPGRLNPFDNPDAALARRNLVLDRMLRAGFIDAEAHNNASAQPLALSPPAPRYGTIAPWHTERARVTIETARPSDYARGGLLVETSADPLLSHAAEEAARAHLENLGGSPEVAALIWDHQTGYVRTTVGGSRWSETRFDRATQACRQPGSAFKPLVYAAAVEADLITPGTPLRDGPVAQWDDSLEVYWKPTNSGRNFRGVALAQDALAASLNTPAINVFDQVGPDRVIDLARRLGITTELTRLRPLSLGASCVVPMELASVYASFASRGRAVEPIFVVRVMRGEKVLYDRSSVFDPTLSHERRLDRMVAHLDELRREPVLDAPSAFLMTAMLRDVVTRGTGVAARSLPWPAAGKTGTTNGNTDAWFVGFTGRVVAAVWLGHDDPSHTLGRRQDGGHAALPLWMQLVRLAEAERTPADLPGPPPEGVVQARVDRDSGLLARPGAGGAIDLYFRSGTEPTEEVGTSATGGDLARDAHGF